MFCPVLAREREREREVGVDRERERGGGVDRERDRDREREHWVGLATVKRKELSHFEVIFCGPVQPCIHVDY